METQEVTAVNWPVVLGVGLVGALMIVAAFCLEKWLGWSGVSVAVLVNVGSAVLLVSIVFFVQPRFLKRVTEAVQGAAIASARAESSDLRARLDDLDARFSAATQERDAILDETVEAVAIPTYGSIGRAIADAEALGSIRHATIKIQGSASPGELGLTVSWGHSAPNGRFKPEGGDELAVEANVFRPIPELANLWRVIAVQWHPGESFESVGVALVTELQKAGEWHGERTLDWPQAMRNLRGALDWASRSRRHTGDADQLRGQLIEVVADGCALTTSGVECPSRQVFVPAAKFPKLVLWRFRKKEAENPWSPPPVPEGVEERLWGFVMSRAKATYPLSPPLFKTFPDWVPLSTGPAED